MNKIITKRLSIILGSLIFALGFQYLCTPRDFLDFDDLDFWIGLILGFIIYLAIIRIIIWVIDGYKLNTHTGITKLLVSLLSIAVALGVQYLTVPYDLLDDDLVFWYLITLNFAEYWAIVRIIIWFIDGYKSNTKIRNIKLLVSIFSLIFALGFQYLSNPRDFLDLDDWGFWLFLTLGFIIYWTIVRVMIWFIDSYKINTKTGNIKLLVFLTSIAVALGVQYLIDPRDFLDFDDGDFWVTLTIGFTEYWILVAIIIWFNKRKLNTGSIITLIFLIFAFIFVLAIIFFMIIIKHLW